MNIAVSSSLELSSSLDVSTTFFALWSLFFLGFVGDLFSTASG
jgi:hypothetical protein